MVTLMFGILGGLYSGGFGWVMSALQIGCLLHALLRRRDYYWYLVIMVVPLFGALAYLFINILPELRRVNVTEITQPLQTSSMRLRRAETALLDANTPVNRLNLAREFKRAKRYDDAIKTLEPLRQGIQRDDPMLQYEMAEAKFFAGQTQVAIEELQVLSKNCPMEFRGPTWLLLARSHESQNNIPEAEQAFKEAIKNFSGEEAKYRYANFLAVQFRADQAKPLLDEIIRTVKRSSGVYRQEQREWLGYSEELKKKIG